MFQKFVCVCVFFQIISDSTSQQLHYFHVRMRKQGFGNGKRITQCQTDSRGLNKGSKSLDKLPTVLEVEEEIKVQRDELASLIQTQVNGSRKECHSPT